MYPILKDTDFKCNIDFQKFWVKIPKIGHFGPKSINFLILTKFCMYSISTVLISNMLFALKDFELKSPNLGILGQEALTLILTKIRMCPILKVLLSNLTLVLKNLSLNPKIRPSELFNRPSELFNRPSKLFNRPSELFNRPSKFFNRPSKLFNLNRIILLLLFFGGAYFNYYIWTKIHKFGNNGTKLINASWGNFV